MEGGGSKEESGEERLPFTTERHRCAVFHNDAELHQVTRELPLQWSLLVFAALGTVGPFPPLTGMRR